MADDQSFREAWREATPEVRSDFITFMAVLFAVGLSLAIVSTIVALVLGAIGLPITGAAAGTLLFVFIAYQLVGR